MSFSPQLTRNFNIKLDRYARLFPSGARFLSTLRPGTAGMSGIRAQPVLRIRAVQYIPQLAQHPLDGTKL